MTKQGIAAFGSGLIFAVGLGVAGMTKPSKVMGFLDPLGDWDPSLALVMVGAIVVNLVAYRLVARRSAPLLGGVFQIPTRKDIDARLVAGAALFGVGWGLAGYCPGPGLTSLAGAPTTAGVFVAAMLGGMAVFTWFDRVVLTSRASDPGPQLAPRGEPVRNR